MRECFHSELAVESSAKGIEDLVFLLCTVPDYCQYYSMISEVGRNEHTVPLMHVTNGRVGRGLPITPRATRVIESTRRVFLNHLWEELLIDVTGREIGLEPVFWVLVLIVVSETRLLLNLVIFIVANPDDNGWVMTQPTNVVDRFLSDGLEQVGPGWVVSTAEHKVLPNQHTEFVARVVEAVILIDATTPHSVNC